MGIHKLTAGSGYDYLTRQVAGMDATSLGGASLASYYTEKGETPGEWVGSGVAALGGLTVGDVVTAEQMRALYGVGRHPLSRELTAAFVAANPDATPGQVAAAGMLGAPFKVFDNDVTPFQIAVADRVKELMGEASDVAAAPAVRARARTEVGLEFFRTEQGRDPLNAKELSALVARLSRPRTTAVAGYDLTFSPVKSISALWALSDPATAAVIETAHRGAITDALAMLERQAVFTRRGANGVRQVEVTGLVAAAFTHRDSRAGDPDLHTHVAVANKVQARDDGAWLSIDGRVLYAATVTASETYNTALEHRLVTGLGVAFADRDGQDPRKRPVREIVGIPPDLLDRWSTRREHINSRRAELARQFQGDHGRQPSPIEAIHLAQQATLETRDAKHEPRSLAQQRAAWQADAEDVLGGPRHVEEMLHRVRHTPPAAPADTTSGAWRAEVATRILATLEERRAVWGTWHARAEAHRRVRGHTPATDVEDLVDDLVRRVTDLCIPIGVDPADHADDPALLRRSDGASVYSVAGSRRYTSTRILAAEQRLVDAAGRTTGWRIPDRVVDLALLEIAANARRLNTGQVALVRAMATSGRAVQLAIAPAGSGKTTAMQALTAAWTGAGGTVIGLAPSAAAAAGLGAQTGSDAHTLATLTWGLTHDALPGWAQQVTARTLVIIDEAAMAATLDLDAAVTYLTGRGATVRLIGDDQQLAAIGAGGVLRDIRAAHGALDLGDVVRFTNPAEAAASLALRDGHREATAFYADHDRIHVGDLESLADDTFTGWLTDQAAGLDALMIAPTRDLVRDLNQRAQTHRLHLDPGSPGTGGVALADGTTGLAGDLIVTRRNDRRLAYGRRDWVKNGDRFRIRTVHATGSLDVEHAATGRTLTLPADYVRADVDLGYAATVHTVQGVTADTMHGIATGDMTRQQLYTMVTRGRLANHLYLDSAVTGDPEHVIRPQYLHPPSPTDHLHALIALDGSPRSATTQYRESADPRTQLAAAADIYSDALTVAITDITDPAVLAQITDTAERLAPGMTGMPAWPAARAALLLVAANRGDAASILARAIKSRTLDDAVDSAAVIHWRLKVPVGGPLPWLPPVPHDLRTHPTWGPYLTGRAAQLADTAAAVRHEATHGPPPAWVAHQAGLVDPGLLAQVEVWRAATHVADDDPRATGPAQWAVAHAEYQKRLDRRLSSLDAPALREWGATIHRHAPTATHDDVTYLATRLAAAARAGVPAARLLADAARGPALPDDQPAAALWWRITGHLEALPEIITVDPHQDQAFRAVLAGRLPPDQVGALTGSPIWPSVIDAVDLAARAGWSLTDLADIAAHTDPHDHDPAHGLLWRLTTLLRGDPDPTTEPDKENPEPEDYHPYPAGPENRQGQPENPPPDIAIPDDPDREPPPPWDDQHPAGDPPQTDPYQGEQHALTPQVRLALAAQLRMLPTRLEPSDAMLRRQETEAAEWLFCPVPRERMIEINQLTAAYYQACYPGSWSQAYLTDRLRTDLTGHPHIRPGHAPGGWTHLVDHLRRAGVHDDEMLLTGVASQASTGRLIDRFRDRLVLPITSSDGDLVGFVGRRHPHHDTAGPKYLNTPDTPLYKKGNNLYGASTADDAGGLIPTLVEGPLDALTITLAAGHTHHGLATLGTALTPQQAQHLATYSHDPVVATDGDTAGLLAAERAYWLLTPHGLAPRIARWPDGTDPAHVLHHHGPRQVAATLEHAISLTEHLINQRRDSYPSAEVDEKVLPVLAAAPPIWWHELPTGSEHQFAGLVGAWDRDPRAAADHQLAKATSHNHTIDACRRLTHEQPRTPDGGPRP